jgi:hypothetical protein
MITHEITGDDVQAVVLTLGAGGEVRAGAEPGAWNRLGRPGELA